MEAMGVVHEGLAAHPRLEQLQELSDEVEHQFVAHKTPDTAAVVDEMTEAKNKAQAHYDDVRLNSFKHFPIEFENQRSAELELDQAKSAFARVKPLCAQYQRISFFRRKCAYCGRKKAICEASRPAKERLDKAQAQHKKVSASSGHFVYLLAISFSNFSPSWYYLVMRCKSGCRCTI